MRNKEGTHRKYLIGWGAEPNCFGNREAQTWLVFGDWLN